MSSVIVPQVGQMKPAPNTVSQIRRIVLSAPDAEALASVTRLLRRELASAGGVQVPVVIDPEELASGDLRLKLTAPSENSSEGYTLTTAEEAVILEAEHPTGIYYGTRTMWQLLHGCGIQVDISDSPLYRQRGVMLDLGRKYLSPAWIQRFIREMGWLKLNTLHLHLNDNTGVRMDSRTHPEIVSSPTLDRDELAAILSVAAEHQVTVIPEFDTPAHARAIVDSHPEFALHDRDGNRHEDKIDFSLEAARELVADVLIEWAGLFDDPWFHLGGDEFFAAPWEPERLQDPDLYPSLVSYASDRLGHPASAQDAYIIYLNDLGDLLRERGKNIKVWNDHVDPRRGSVKLESSTQVDVWIRWNEQYPSAADFADAGHSLTNRHGDYLYFILSSDPGSSEPNKSPRQIYERWNPSCFMGAANRADLDVHAPADGAILSVWCDDPDVMTESQLFESLSDWLRTFSQRVWGTPAEPTYDAFADLFLTDSDVGVRTQTGQQEAT